MTGRPISSPWGEVQHCDTLLQGVHMVTTAGHGGIMVHGSCESTVLSPTARKCGFRENGYLCFEEDSQEAVVLRELLDKGLWSLPERIQDKEAFENALNESLQQYNPEYWQAREKNQHSPRKIESIAR